MFVIQLISDISTAFDSYITLINKQIRLITIITKYEHIGLTHVIVILTYNAAQPISITLLKT